MKLSQPYSRRNTEVSFNTPEPVKAEVSATPEIPPLVPNKPELPPLMKSGNVQPAIPKLERAGRKQVELAPPEPVEVKNEFDRSEDIRLGGEEPDLQFSGSLGRESSDCGSEQGDDGQTGISFEEPVPELQRSGEQSESAIPKLVVSRDTGAPPVGVTDIPKLDAYNKMEVVHLLIGRSVEDDEIVLLQSYPERFVRSVNKEDFNQSLMRRVQTHYNKMRYDHLYDLAERGERHRFDFSPVSSMHAARGVEWVAVLHDDGQAAVADVQAYAQQENISFDEALEEVQENNLYGRDPGTVFSWALVKVKIGHDFGSYKLSELMPTL